ncbi:hypothetical protein [Thermotoga sp. SG1]|uniref:hypothetical protein n=1 Tax=Thermotoga sp. SG1 TaxID=126739 RepID=UPI000C7818B8|nr:hypothetical protein [Thermotoga sp. SG1]PLV57136.1 hypothetical protein AS006_02240 [Thermotoga sp. SG1]
MKVLQKEGIRTELKQFVGKTVKIVGNVKKFGATRHPSCNYPTMLLTNVIVRYGSKSVKIDHLWTVIKRLPHTLDIAVGDRIGFKADVVRYSLLPAFKNKNDILHFRYNYGVANPRDFRIIRRSVRSRKRTTLYDAFLKVL